MISSLLSYHGVGWAWGGWIRYKPGCRRIRPSAALNWQLVLNISFKIQVENILKEIFFCIFCSFGKIFWVDCPLSSPFDWLPAIDRLKVLIGWSLFQITNCQLHFVWNSVLGVGGIVKTKFKQCDLNYLSYPVSSLVYSGYAVDAS